MFVVALLARRRVRDRVVDRASVDEVGQPSFQAAHAVPARQSRCRTWSPEDASMGAVPFQDAKWFLSGAWTEAWPGTGP